MRIWKGAQVLSVSLMLVSLLVLITMSYSWLIEAVTLIGLTAFFVLFIWADRKLQSIKHNGALDQIRKTAIKTMDFQRHDWMNDLQVFYGYLKLKKYDNLEQCVEKIKEKMNQDSMITRLGIPSLILFFLSFRTQNNLPFHLNIEIHEEINLLQLSLDSALVNEIILDAVNHYRNISKSSSGELNQLNIGFDLQKHHLILGFIYKGEFSAEPSGAEIKQKLLKSKAENKLDYDIVMQEQTDEIWVRFPVINQPLAT